MRAVPQGVSGFSAWIVPNRYRVDSSSCTTHSPGPEPAGAATTAADAAVGACAIAEGAINKADSAAPTVRAERRQDDSRAKRMVGLFLVREDGFDRHLEQPGDLEGQR